MLLVSVLTALTAPLLDLVLSAPRHVLPQTTRFPRTPLAQLDEEDRTRAADRD